MEMDPALYSDAWVNNDPFLEIFVELANKGTMEMSVTFHVNGLIISGMLTGAKRYYDYVEKLFQDSGKTEEFKGAQVLDAIPQMFRDAVKENQDDSGIKPRYVHLRDIRTYTADGKAAQTPQEIFWRGKLSSVNGFTIGSLHPIRKLSS